MHNDRHKHYLIKVPDSWDVILPGLPHDLSRVRDHHCCVPDGPQMHLIALQDRTHYHHVVLLSHLQEEGREKMSEGEKERDIIFLTSCDSLTVGPFSADSANSVQGSFSLVHMKKGIPSKKIHNSRTTPACAIYCMLLDSK